MKINKSRAFSKSLSKYLRNTPKNRYYYKNVNTNVIQVIMEFQLFT